MYLTEILAALVGLVDCHHKYNLCGARVNPGEIDMDALVIPLALAGEVVAGMLNCSVGRGGVVVEYEIFVGQELAVLAQYEGRGIEVKIIACARAVGVPSETYGEFGKIDGNPLTFFEIYSHKILFSGISMRICLPGTAVPP